MKIVVSLALRVSLLLVALMGYGCADSTSLHYGDDYSTISIAHLRTMANGISTTILSNCSITGYVTANDLYDELYKQIVVEDDTGGIEIGIDKLNLYKDFPLYSKVTIQCHGLALGRYGSMVELGAKPTGEFATDRIAASQLSRYFTISPEESVAVAPIKCSISSLTPRLIGRMVRVDNLRADVPQLPWCDYDKLLDEYVTTTRVVVDGNGSRLNIVTSGMCQYANETMPQGTFSLCGIVEYHGGQYHLRIVNHSIFPDYS